MYLLHPLQILCKCSNSWSTQIYREDNFGSSTDGEVKLGREFQLETLNRGIFPGLGNNLTRVTCISCTRFKYSACMFSNSCSRRHIYREDNFRCSMSVSYLYRIKSLWHIYRWRTFSEISLWCFLSSISQFALMIVMETKFTTFAVFRANEGETSPLGMESPLAVRSLRGGGFPLKPKSQGIQTETMLPSQVPVNLSKGCCGWVQNRRNPLYADVKYSGHCQGHMGRNCSNFFC